MACLDRRVATRGEHAPDFPEAEFWPESSPGINPTGTGANEAPIAVTSKLGFLDNASSGRPGRNTDPTV